MLIMSLSNLPGVLTNLQGMSENFHIFGNVTLKVQITNSYKHYSGVARLNLGRLINSVHLAYCKIKGRDGKTSPSLL